MNRKLSPKTNAPTVATLTVAFLSALLHWALAALPDGVPPEVVGTGYTLGLALVAVTVGKLAQHFTWAQDTVDEIRSAESIIAAAERGEHDG